jgi:hypothetical protein
LKAKLALVKHDLNEARDLMKQAQIIAEEKGLNKLAIRISNEYDKLIDQVEYWEKLKEEGVSIQEKLKITKLEESISRMSNRRTIEEQSFEEEEPITLLIIYKSGIPVFTKHFSDDTELDDLVISAFLTTFNITLNNFMSEAFTGETYDEKELELPIERIKYGEYTIALTYESSLLFVYIFKGASFSAMKKLRQFKEEITNSETWESLINMAITGNRVERLRSKLEEIAKETFFSN